MAVVPNSHPAPFGAISAYRAVSTIETVLTRASNWSKARKAEKALMQLSDRELDDIGLIRGDIPGVAQNLIRR